jgi:hypothetical protein
MQLPKPVARTDIAALEYGQPETFLYLRSQRNHPFIDEAVFTAPAVLDELV